MPSFQMKKFQITLLYIDFVNANILKPLYYALFESHINCACIMWGQNISTINCLCILQKKALRTINFKEHNAHSSPLFDYSKIIKIANKVKIGNCLCISKYTNNKLLSVFTNWFFTFSMSHNYQTLFAYKGNIQIPSVQTISYGRNAFVYMIIELEMIFKNKWKGWCWTQFY